jgi:hypothetical protein
MKPKIFSLINSFGWKISSSKVHITSKNNPKRAQEVTGIVVNAHPNVARKNVRKFESIIHHIECDISSGALSTFIDLESKYRTIDSLTGYANFMRQINPKFQEYVDRVQTIRKKLV